MNLTISLDETQAAHLLRQASSNQLSPEQFARDLLARALGQLANEEAWGQVNQRRVLLIRKSRDHGLTAGEEKELEQLQAAVDQRLEPLDWQLLAAAERLRQLAEGLPDDTEP